MATGVAAEQVYFAAGTSERHRWSGAWLVTIFTARTAEQRLVAVEFTTGKMKWQAEDRRGVD